MLNFSSWLGRKQTPPLPQTASPSPASPPPPRTSDKPKPSLDDSAAPTLVSPTAEYPRYADRERRGSVQIRAASQPPPAPPPRAALKDEPEKEKEKDAPPRTQWSTPLQTEHDEVLAKLLGEGSGSTKGKEKENANEKKPAAEADKLRSRETVQTGASGAGGVPSLKVDPVYDPFTGSTLGYTPRPAVPPGDDARDALWDQMAAVRALQSEIAGMHLTMENVGMGSADMGAGRGSAGMGKRRGSAGAGAEKLDELGEDGAEAKEDEKARRERDRLFERAEQTFEGRKEDIDSIMGKLDELSNALTKLHMLDMPQLDLDADFSGPERGNTDSTFGVPSPTDRRPQHPDVRRLSRLPSHGSMFGAAGRPSRMGSEGYVLESPASMMSALPDPMEKGPNEG